MQDINYHRTCDVAVNEAPKIKLSPEEIDQLIIEEIDNATEENSSIWTCPDYNRREYVHSFFQYPAMMIPAVQRRLIEIISTVCPDVKNVIDPFMGSATTLVACMEFGLNCYGQDINPLAFLIAKTRTGPYYTSAIKEKYEDLIARVNIDNSNKIEVKFKGIDKWFKPNIQRDLSKLVRAIRQEPRLAIRRFFWVILAETVRMSSNDRTSTFKLHIRPIEQINQRNFSAIDVFQFHMDKSIEDYEAHANLLKQGNQLHRGVYASYAEVRILDSKESIYNPISDPYYDLLVTSPPYGDNKTTVTYGQYSYLPLQWIDLIDIDSKVTNEYLKSTSEIDTQSLGGKLLKSNNDIINLLKISPTLKKTYELIKKTDSNKEKKVIAFMLDLNQTIDNIFNVMKPNSYQIWTVGNRNVAGIEICNDKIITELIQHKGAIIIKKLEREILNKRMAKRNKNTVLMNTEDILIFRKIG
ncbi:MAG: DNA methyltransferase [Chitinophagales bacterium]